MKVINKFLDNYWLVAIASLVMSIIISGLFYIGENNIIRILSFFSVIIDIFIMSFFYRFIIKSVAGKKDVKNNYFKLVGLNFVLTLSTYAISYIVTTLFYKYETLIGLGIGAIILYLIKILISFSFYEIVLNNCKILTSIKNSICLCIKKENILKILKYNILFIVILYLPNVIIEACIADASSVSVVEKNAVLVFMTTFVIEVTEWFVFIFNEQLYLSLKNKNEEKK